MIGVSAEIGAVSGDDPLIQTGSCRDGLKGGTRAVESVCRPVDQRRIFRIQNGFIISLIIFQVVCRRCDHAQNAGSFGIQHNDRTAGDLFQPQFFRLGIPQAVKIIDKAVQNVLQFPLIVAVDSQLNRLASLHRGFHVRRNDNAVFYGDFLDAVSATQSAFHGTFNAAFSHGIIQGVTLRLQLFVFLRIDGTDSTDLVGNDIALCYRTYRLFHNVHAGKCDATFFQFRDHIQRHILCQSETVAEGKATKLHLIADSGEQSLFLRRIAVVNVIVLFQLVHAVVRCGIDIHVQVFLELADRFVITGKGVWLCIRDRQGSVPFYAVFVQDVYQREQHLVALGVVLRESVRLNDNIIAYLVFDDGFAGGIHDLATGGADGLGVFLGGNPLCGVGVAFHNLYFHQPPGTRTAGKQYQHTGERKFDIAGCRMFHEMLLSGEKQGGTAREMVNFRCCAAAGHADSSIGLCFFSMVRRRFGSRKW